MICLQVTARSLRAGDGDKNLLINTLWLLVDYVQQNAFSDRGRGKSLLSNCLNRDEFMRSKHSVAGAVALLALVACRANVTPEATSSAPVGSVAQAYYWRAKPGMLAAYNAYIRDVAQPIDEDARRHGAFIAVMTYQSRDTLSPWTHMRVFLLRDSAQLASLGAALNAAGARVEPDSAKRRARSDYAATLRDAAGSAALDIIH